MQKVTFTTRTGTDPQITKSTVFSVSCLQFAHCNELLIQAGVGTKQDERFWVIQSHSSSCCRTPAQPPSVIWLNWILGSEKFFAAPTYPQSIGRLTLRFEKAAHASVRKMDLYLCYLQKPRRERQTERHVNFLPHSPQILFLNVSKHIFPRSRTTLALTLEHSQQCMRLF